MEACPLQTGGYECLDTSTSLETCGACSLMVIQMFQQETKGSLIVSQAGARDCSAIANVDVVECVQGGCKISALVHSD